TVRLCTPWRAANSRIDNSSTRRSRRIRSNNSTRDRTPADLPHRTDSDGKITNEVGPTFVQTRQPPPPAAHHTRRSQNSRRQRPHPGPDQVTTLISTRSPGRTPS